MPLEIHEVSKAYGELLVLDRFSLTLPDKGIVCLLGPSGCGKTTLLRLLAGLEEPDEGYIRGLEKKKIAMVFQEDRLIPSLDAWHNISIVNEKYDVSSLMKNLKLEEAAHKPVSQLSGGMKRRVAVGRAIAYEGEVTLMDEPFKGLDQETKTAVMDLVRPLGESTLLIFVTHDLDEAAYLADSIIRLSGPPLRLI